MAAPSPRRSPTTARFPGRWCLRRWATSWLSRCATGLIAPRRCTGTASPCATTWTGHHRQHRTSSPAVTSPTGSRFRIRHLLGTPHTGLDADTGLYFPVIVDDPNEPGSYDAEWVVMLDDWTDGVGSSPAQIYDGLRNSPGGHNMPGMDMPGMSGMGTVPGSAEREPARCSVATPGMSVTPTIWSTDVFRRRPVPFESSLVIVCGSG